MPYSRQMIIEFICIFISTEATKKNQNTYLSRLTVYVAMIIHGRKQVLYQNTFQNFHNNEFIPQVL